MNPFQTSSNTYLIAKQMASSPNDEQAKRGAEEPGLLLHNNTYYSLVCGFLLYITVVFFCWVFYMFSKDIIKLNINKSSL